MEARAGEYLQKEINVFTFEKTPRISHSCKPVPVQYREKYGLFTPLQCNLLMPNDLFLFKTTINWPPCPCILKEVHKIAMKLLWYTSIKKCLVIVFKFLKCSFYMPIMTPCYCKTIL